MRIPEFALGADNLYRTKNYIVKQVLSISMFEENNNNIVSVDTFYKRTKKRDKEYASLFEGELCVSDGKRLHCTMTTRKYVK